MPELPEVEVMRTALHGFLSGAVITHLRISEVWSTQLTRDGSRFAVDGPRRAEEDGTGGLIGREVRAVSRHGKYYFIELEEPQAGLAPEGTASIEGHLRMTGGWWLRPPASEWPADFPDKHCHLIIDLDDGSQAIYRDVRRFGTLAMRTREEEVSRRARMGLDPLANNWRFKRFLKAIDGTRRALKTVLLDQARIAGLGNIYACEVAHIGRVSPLRRTDDLSVTEARRIFDAIGPLLRESARVGGTRLTELDDLQYIHEPQLHLDNFEVRLRVYGREGEACLRRGCGGIIERFVQQQRPTFWCPSCQHRSRRRIRSSFR
jgi:formamidopyrimidine-DNA glycosylase